MVHWWVGTSFFCARCARSSHPRRSSTQLLNLAALPGASGALEDNLLSAGDDFQRRERPRRRARNVLALEVVRAVVARAPDVRTLSPVLNRAIEVRALGRQRPELPGRRPEEEHRLSAERDDASRVGSDVGGLEVQLELRERRLGGFRGHEVAQDGIKNGEPHGDEARPQKVGGPSPARRPRLVRCYVQGSLTVGAIVFFRETATCDASASMIWWDQTYHDSSGSSSLCRMAKTRAPSLRGNRKERVVESPEPVAADRNRERETMNGLLRSLASLECDGAAAMAIHVAVNVETADDLVAASSEDAPGRPFQQRLTRLVPENDPVAGVRRERRLAASRDPVESLRAVSQRRTS